MSPFEAFNAGEVELPEVVQDISENIFGKRMESLGEFFEWIEEGLNTLLKNWGFIDGDEDVPSQIRSGMMIESDGQNSYIVNPDDNSRVEVDPNYDLDNDGCLSREELESYIDVVRSQEAENADWPEGGEPVIQHAVLLNEALQAHMRNLAGTVNGNLNLDNVDDETVDYSNARPDEAIENIGERVPDSPMYNLKYRVPNSYGANVLTSGVPGSENGTEERERMRSEIAGNPEYESWMELSDPAFDIMYAYTFHNVRNIFSLSYHAVVRDGVNELVQARLLNDGPIRFGGDSINTDSYDLTSRNKRLLAEAVSMNRSTNQNSCILFRCTHGVHRAVFTMLSVYMIENDCSREEAERANGVRTGFISMYPGFDSQLDQVHDSREEILAMI